MFDPLHHYLFVIYLISSFLVIIILFWKLFNYFSKYHRQITKKEEENECIELVVVKEKQQSDIDRSSVSSYYSCFSSISNYSSDIEDPSRKLIKRYFKISKRTIF